MALKSETMGSYGRNAGDHRVRLLPNRAASPRAPTVFQPRLSVRGRDPHDCSDASYVGGCNDGRSGFRTDRPRLRVRGDRGPIAAHRLMVPTVMAKTYNRASLRLSVTIIGLGRVRLRAAPVSPALCRCRGPGFDRSRPARGGPRGRRPRCSPTWPAWVRAWDFRV